MNRRQFLGAGLAGAAAALLGVEVAQRPDTHAIWVTVNGERIGFITKWEPVAPLVAVEDVGHAIVAGGVSCFELTISAWR